MTNEKKARLTANLGKQESIKAIIYEISQELQDYQERLALLEQEQKKIENESSASQTSGNS